MYACVCTCVCECVCVYVGEKSDPGQFGFGDSNWNFVLGLCEGCKSDTVPRPGLLSPMSGYNSLNVQFKMWFLNFLIASWCDWTHPIPFFRCTNSVVRSHSIKFSGVFRPKLQKLSRSLSKPPVVWICPKAKWFKNSDNSNPLRLEPYPSLNSEMSDCPNFKFGQWFSDHTLF